MAVIIFFLCGYLLFRMYRDWGAAFDIRASWRMALLFDVLTMGALLVLSTEVFSLFRSLTFTTVCLFWGAVAVAAFLLHRRFSSRAISRPAPTPNPLSRTQKGLLVGVAVLLALTAITAVAAPPNNWDSMTYHMTRVKHWEQYGSISFFPTHNLRQLCMPPFAEYAILHLEILSGGDRFANLVQWIALVGSLIGVSLIAKEIGASSKGQILSAVFAATLPMAVLQSSSTQNDLVVSLWMVCLVLFCIRFARSANWASAIPFGVSLGLATLTKGTSWVFAFPICAWCLLETLRASNKMPREPRCASGRVDARKGDDAVPGSGTVRSTDAADAGPRRNPEGRGAFACMPVSRRLGASDSLCAGTHAPWPAAKSTPSRPRVILLEALSRMHCVVPHWAAIGAIVLALNAGYFARNMEGFGHPLGDFAMQKELQNEEISPRVTVSNLLRNLALHASLPPRPSSVKAYANRLMIWVHDRLGMDVSDSVCTWQGTQFDWPTLHARSWQEDDTGSPAHLLVIALCCVALLLPGGGSSKNASRILMGSILAGFVLFCLAFRWQPWHARLHLPLFAMAAPVVGGVVGNLRWRRVISVCAFALVILALPPALLNARRPILGPRSIFVVPRTQQYFVDKRYKLDEYIEAADFVRSRGLREVGLIETPDTHEYQMWILLQRGNRSGVFIRHVLVPNSSQSQDTWVPQAIIVLKAVRPDELTVSGRVYRIALRGEYASVYLPEQDGGDQAD